MQRFAQMTTSGYSTKFYADQVHGLVSAYVNFAYHTVFWLFWVQRQSEDKTPAQIL